MATHHSQLFNDSALTKAALNKRLEESSWGFFSVNDRGPLAAARWAGPARYLVDRRRIDHARP